KISGGSGNVVEGNFIGTDPTGTQALSNFTSGVSISGPSPNDIIGGTAPGAGNLISGNIRGEDGLQISNSSGDVVLGNLIGTDVTGTRALGNARAGVELTDSPNCTIGGTATAARN